MGVILATRNVLVDLASSNIAVSGPSAPGFSPLDMVQGDLDRAWLAGGPSNLWNIDVRLPPGLPITFAAIFDVRPRPSAVTLYKSATWPITSPVLVGALQMYFERGDGARQLGSDIGAVACRFQISFSSSVTPSVGKIWLGDAAPLPSDFLELDDAPGFAQIRNDTDTGGVLAHELADMRERFGLAYNALSGNHYAVIAAAWKDCRGGLRPSVLIPDDATPSRVYMGRLEPELPTTMQAGSIRTGTRLNFRESGRGIRVG